jgi:hypothetical protein
LTIKSTFGVTGQLAILVVKPTYPVEGDGAHVKVAWLAAMPAQRNISTPENNKFSISLIVLFLSYLILRAAFRLLCALQLKSDVFR